MVTVPFQVERLSGKVDITKYRIGEGGPETYQDTEDAGAMLYCKQGHSIRVRQPNELKRLLATTPQRAALLKREALIDAMEDGEASIDDLHTAEITPKQAVERATKRRVQHAMMTQE